MTDSTTSSPAEASTISRSRPFATLVLFTLAGPIIGYFVFTLALPVVVSMPNATPRGQWAVSMLVLIFTPFILFSYVIGGIPAFAAGVLVILAERFAPRVLPLALLAPVAGFLSSYAWGLYYFPKTNAEMILLTSIAGTGSALVCYLIARRLGYVQLRASAAPR